MSSKHRVAYYYDDEVGNYNYGYGHPMKPFRMRMAHNLITAYELDKQMTMLRPTRATAKEMTKFHSDDYIDYLERVTPEFSEKMPVHTARYLPGDDCPPFDGVFEFCSISAGGSIEGAKRLNHGDSDIVINWSGGLHHAKKGEASGFCYINDIVLGILELLRYHQRVMYLDIDVHHGDGVEEAFYTTDRVMSVSFHKYGDFFPGTGHINDVGIGRGKHYSVNVPLRDGINDESYKSIFQPVMKKVMESYRPGAIFMQCGTDSLSGDRLGCFNLSMRGHAACVEFMKSFNVPLFCVGGGGYTIRNVARTWVYETSVLLNKEVSPVLPYNDFYEFYGPEYRLDVPANNMDDTNSREYLDKLIRDIHEHLRHVPHAPSVQMQEVPRDWADDDSENDEYDDNHIDTRDNMRQRDARIVPETEFSDSDSESSGGSGSRRNERSYRRSGDTTKSFRQRATVNAALAAATPEITDEERIDRATPTPVSRQSSANASSSGGRRRARSTASNRSATQPPAQTSAEPEKSKVEDEKPVESKESSPQQTAVKVDSDAAKAEEPVASADNSTNSVSVAASTAAPATAIYTSSAAHQVNLPTSQTKDAISTLEKP